MHIAKRIGIAILLTAASAGMVWFITALGETDVTAAVFPLAGAIGILFYKGE